MVNTHMHPKVYFHCFLGFKVLLFRDKDVFLLLSTGRIFFHMRRLFSAFRGSEKGLSVIPPAISQVASVQNNQYVIVGAGPVGASRLIGILKVFI